MIRVLDGSLEVALAALKRKPSRNTDKRTERVGVGMSERGGRVNECAAKAHSIRTFS